MAQRESVMRHDPDQVQLQGKRRVGLHLMGQELHQEKLESGSKLKKGVYEKIEAQYEQTMLSMGQQIVPEMNLHLMTWNLNERQQNYPIRLNHFNCGIKLLFNLFFPFNKNRENITFICHGIEPIIATVSIHKGNIIFRTRFRTNRRRTPNISKN